MAKKTVTRIQIPSARSEDQPATRKMLSLVRDELLQKMEAGFSHAMAESTQIRSELQEIKAANSRMELLLEEQNSNNRIVLEGLQALWQRQEKIEQRFF